jgi:hypothetical protein
VTEPRKKAATIWPTDALDTVYRDLVVVHYGLAEHGPTEPKETAMWVMRELRGVLDDIQAVKRAQPTSLQD